MATALKPLPCDTVPADNAIGFAVGSAVVLLVKPYTVCGQIVSVTPNAVTLRHSSIIFTFDTRPGGPDWFRDSEVFSASAEYTTVALVKEAVVAMGVPSVPVPE